MVHVGLGRGLTSIPWDCLLFLLTVILGFAAECAVLPTLHCVSGSKNYNTCPEYIVQLCTQKPITVYVKMHATSKSHIKTYIKTSLSQTLHHNLIHLTPQTKLIPLYILTKQHTRTTVCMHTLGMCQHGSIVYIYPAAAYPQWETMATVVAGLLSIEEAKAAVLLCL